MASFKFKLMAYFAGVALVPVVGAFYGFSALAKRHETQRIDNRLRADLQGTVAGYAQWLDTAERRAEAAPLGMALRRLRPGIDPRDTLLAGRDGMIAAGPLRGQQLPLVLAESARVTYGGITYHGLVTNTLDAAGGVQFAALARQSEVDGAIAADRWGIAFALLAAVLGVGLLVYLLGSSIVRTLGRLSNAADDIARGRFRERIPVAGRDEFAQAAAAFNRMAAQLEQRIDELEYERRRTREVTVRFGEALTATHDVEALLRVIVETMIEATAAEGGFVLTSKGELARAGNPDAGAKALELPLTVDGEEFGKVVLTGAAFDEEQVATASSLVAQAAVALENAQLHGIVERQALIDPLTSLSNRRALEESLHEEIARAARFGSDVCFVLADIDRFKRVNDRHGHPTGDRALRVFAQTLREVVREIDTAGRWGGEEFALILPGTDIEGGVAVAERIRKVLTDQEIVSAGGEPFRLTASFGVAGYSDAGDLVSLVESADDALYWAKRAGRDRVAAATDQVTR